MIQEENLDYENSKDAYSSQKDLTSSLSKEKVMSDAQSVYFSKKNSSQSDQASPLGFVKKQESRGSEIKLRKRKTTDVNGESKFRRKRRTSSINSFTAEFHSKKLVPKAREIYGINRVATFHRNCTLKECLEKIMCVPENKLIELNSELRVVSILTLSDIISFLNIVKT